MPTYNYDYVKQNEDLPLDKFMVLAANIEKKSPNQEALYSLSDPK